MSYSRKYEGCKELLLNKLCNQKKLNSPFNVGEVMALIRECNPKNFEEWRSWYLTNAKTKTKTKAKEAKRITEDSLHELGVALRKAMRNEFIPAIQKAIETLTDEEIESYVENLAINRTYDGYITEKRTISELISKLSSDITIEESTPEQDHAGNIDYIINVNDHKIGLQIKPVTASADFAGYSLPKRLQESFDNFKKQYGGNVFIVFSKDYDIVNKEVLDKIRDEIKRLKSL